MITILFFATHKKVNHKLFMAFCATADNSGESGEPESSDWQHQQEEYLSTKKHLSK